MLRKKRARSQKGKISYLERWRNVCVRLRYLKHSLKRHHRFIDIYTLRMLYKGPHILLQAPYQNILGGKASSGYYFNYIKEYISQSVAPP